MRDESAYFECHDLLVYGGVEFRLEGELLIKLPRDVLSDAAVDYVPEGLEREIERRHAAISGEMDDMRKRKATLETKIKNLIRAIEGGMDSPAIRAAVTEREQELSAIATKRPGPGKSSVHH